MQGSTSTRDFDREIFWIYRVRTSAGSIVDENYVISKFYYKTDIIKLVSKDRKKI